MRRKGEEKQPDRRRAREVNVQSAFELENL